MQSGQQNWQQEAEVLYLKSLKFVLLDVKYVGKVALLIVRSPIQIYCNLPTTSLLI